MSKIITISREFGSDGRELGKRLADALGLAYYDREILVELAKETKQDQQYIESVMENRLTVPLHFGRSFAQYSMIGGQAVGLLVEQQKIIKDLAKQGDCVIVGRGANSILRDYRPFSVFVYVDWPSKMARCRQRAAEDEKLSDKELQKKIKQIDAVRVREMDFISSSKWGDKQGYSLCVNTSNLEIKRIVPVLAEYARIWQEGGI